MGPLSKLTREEKLLSGLKLADSHGIEIGALHQPLLRPPAARIKYVDHADQATLRAKYAGDPYVPAEAIVPVDAVWGENTLADCFPGEQFDYAIASHVMEHVPDMIGWMDEIAAILRPGGLLILALPDRRYTYDLRRRETSLAELIDTHLRGTRRPTPGQVFDFTANSVDFDHMKAWFSPEPQGSLPAFATPPQALEAARKAQAGAYIDGHCSVFTARSLLDLLAGLLELGLLRFRLERFHVAPVGSAEMSLILRRFHNGDDAAQAAEAFRQMLHAGIDSEGLVLDTAPHQHTAG